MTVHEAYALWDRLKTLDVDEYRDEFRFWWELPKEVRLAVYKLERMHKRLASD